MLNNFGYSKMFLFSPGDSIPHVTPLTAVKFDELAARAGFPKGMINVLPWIRYILQTFSYQERVEPMFFFTELRFSAASQFSSQPLLIENLGKCEKNS